jgi:RNA polymerase sigma factor (sigma-70 family)
MSPGDLELLGEYARKGSEAAFATLVSRHINLVYSVALRQVQDSALAQDVTQVVFVVLARKARSLGPGTVLPAWLSRTAHYVAADALKAQQRRQRREQEAYMQSALHSTETEAEAWTAIAPLLDQAMAGLGEKDQSAIVLRFFQAKEMKEVGAELGLSENAAKTRVCRAIEKLRRFFLRRGITASAAVITAAVSAHSVQAAPAGLAQAATAMAMSKGTLASVSLAALMRGALRRMAWAQAKPAVVAGAVVLFGTAATLESVPAGHPASRADIAGVWEGTALARWSFLGADKQEQPAHCRVVMRIRRTNGVYSASLDEIDLAKRDIRATGVTYEYPYVRFYLGDWGQCAAKVNANATAMTLEFGREWGLNVVLQRTNSPDAVPERLSEGEFAAVTGRNLQGYWEGGVREFFPVNLKIAGESKGGYRGELDLPALGVSHWPFTVTDHGPGLTFESMCGAGTFHGRFNQSGTRLIGVFEMGVESPFTFSRAEYRPEETPPESDYAFSAKTDLQGHWRTEVDAPLLTIMSDGRLKKIPLGLDIAKAADGTYSAAMVAPLIEFLGAGDPMPATNFKHPLPNVHLVWISLGIVFDGKLEDGKLAGKWTMASQSFAATFERRAP